MTFSTAGDSIGLDEWGGVAVFKVIERMSDFVEVPLKQVYGEAVDLTYDWHDFFRQSGARLCLWLEGERCVSALRFEPWKDGLLVTALETAPDRRRLGFASALLEAVLDHVGQGKVYAHIHHRNAASIRVHEKCGFQKIAETARLLDGTVTAQMGTFVVELL